MSPRFIELTYAHPFFASLADTDLQHLQPVHKFQVSYLLLARMLSGPVGPEVLLLIRKAGRTV